MPSETKDKYLNIAGYQFAELAENKLKSFRGSLRARGLRNNLKGTILISKEGVNLFLAGRSVEIYNFMDFFKELTGLSNFQFKESWSDYLPFTRFLVRIKKEIIAFGIKDIDPFHHTSPYVSPHELKQWLDDGEDVVLLDTRNDYEIKVGTFDNALPIGVSNFTHFPKAINKLPPSLKDKKIVTFCTGGIRCEKAAPLMESRGFRNVYQLQGGILKYFEEIGGDHYTGDCFVFDHRVALNANLEETEVQQCYACRAVLVKADLESPDYVPGEKCPYCVEKREVAEAHFLEKRNKRIQEVSNPLPGSIPYENWRPLNIPHHISGVPVLDFLNQLKFRPPNKSWEEIILSGRLTVNGEPLKVDQLLVGGSQIVHHLPNTTEPDINPDIKVVYEDEAIIIIEKPAPLPVHPSGRFNRNTLQYIMREAYSPIVPRIAHRLDANTQGILALTKSKEIASILQPAFEKGEVDKVYRARIHGHPTEDKFVCDALISKTSTTAGGRSIVTDDGLAATTEFVVENRLPDNTSLVKVRLVFGGRTHQIRVHLWHLGFPVVGDSIYLPNHQRGELQTLSPDQPPTCLQSASLTFIHPKYRNRVCFEANAPDWWSANTASC